MVVDRAVLDDAFAALRDNEKVVLVLRYFRDLKVDEVAEVMGVPHGTIASRLHRGHA